MGHACPDLMGDASDVQGGRLGRYARRPIASRETASEFLGRRQVACPRVRVPAMPGKKLNYRILGGGDHFAPSHRHKLFTWSTSLDSGISGVSGVYVHTVYPQPHEQPWGEEHAAWSSCERTTPLHLLRGIEFPEIKGDPEIRDQRSEMRDRRLQSRLGHGGHGKH